MKPQIKTAKAEKKSKRAEKEVSQTTSSSSNIISDQSESDDKIQAKRSSGLTVFFMHKPVAATMLLASGLLLGIYAAQFLRIGLLPNAVTPGLSVITRYPGVAPEKVEKLLTKPIEEKVAEVPGIEQLSSLSEDGESKINVIFGSNVDLKVKIIEVQEKLEQIRQTFSREVEAPYIVPYDPSDRPVFILSLSSKRYDLKYVRGLADKRIKYNFSKVEGVSEVFVGGGTIREIQIFADPLKLISYNISLSDIISLVQANNRYVPAGSLREANLTRTIITDVKYKSVKEIADTLIPYGKDQVIPLRSVAEIKDYFREPENVSRSNGVEKVSIYVMKSGIANTAAVTAACRRVLAELNFPDLNIEVDYDQGEFIEKATKRVTNEIILGSIIAALILWLFLRQASITLLTAIVIPASILTTFLFLFFFKIELNVMTLSGLALGVGLIIDNAIVVVEKMSHISVKDSSNEQSILEKVAEVKFEVLSSTLTIVIVFLPIFFTNQNTRDLYKDLAISLSISVLVSLFLSVTIIPSFYNQLLNPIARNLTERMGHAIQIFWVQIRAFKPFAVLKNKVPGLSNYTERIKGIDIRKKYRQLIYAGCRNFRFNLLILLLIVASGVAAFYLAKKEFIDPIDSGEINASVELDTGINLDATEKAVKEIEKALLLHPAVEKITAKIEKWHASLFIKMKKELRSSMDTDTFIAELKNITTPFKSAYVYFNQNSDGGDSREIDIDLFGDDHQSLKKLAKTLSQELKQAIPGIGEIVLRFREGKPALEVTPKLVELSRLGFTNARIGELFRGALYGIVVTKYYEGDREVDVRLKIDPNFINTPEKLKALYIPGDVKDFVPISSVLKIKEGTEETKLYRKNKQKTVSITVKLAGIDTGTAGQLLKNYLSSYPFEKNYHYDFGENYKKQLEGQREMMLAAFASILLIYFLLGALYESITTPLYVILTVPASILMSLIVIVILGKTLNISVYIGFILTAGISVSGAIMLVSTIRHKKETISPHRAVFAAVFERARPIAMTTSVTMVSMLPLIFDHGEGSNLWRPLAFTILTGVLFSLVVTLYLIPVLQIVIGGAKRGSLKLLLDLRKPVG